MTTSALWYLTRGTGVVSLALLTVVVVLGVLTRGGVRAARLPRFVVSGLHRNASLLAVAFLGVHIATSVADPYAPIRLADAVVPFGSAYRPVWLGLGALALDLLAAIGLTTLIRRRIGRRLWRAVHWLAYAAWPVAVVHALGTGSDARQPWLLAVVAMSVVSVVWAALWRLVDVAGLQRKPGPTGPAPRARRRVVAAAAVVAAPLALAGWTLGGPLAPGWAARAGTPPALLHTASSGAAATGARPAGSAQLLGTFREQVRGDDAVTVAVDGRLSGGSARSLAGAAVDVVLTGAPLGDDGSGGVALTSGVVTLRSAAGTYVGRVTQLSGGLVGAALTGPAGTVQFSANLVVDSAAATSRGTVTVA